MKNVLTYTIPAITDTNAFNLTRTLARHFAVALHTNRLWIGRDVELEHKVCWRTVEADRGIEVMPVSMVTLTFQDEAKALLFKLSHDRGDA